MKITKEMAIEKAERMIAEDTGKRTFHLGMENKVVVKDWNGQRDYINVYCYTLNGRYVGKYDCGYIDKASGEYVTTKYTQIALF